MSRRNLNPQTMFQQLALEHEPRFRFKAADKEGFEAWKAAALPEVIGTLGDFPERVAPDPELIAEWEHDGLRKQKWLINVGRHIAATLLINTALDLDLERQHPVILCWHGHGPFGKEPVMGNDASPEMRASIEAHNYNYGHQMAKAGFVTYAIDWLGCGERNPERKPNHHASPGRDWCNINYLHATMLGMTPISMNVAHGQAATDFVLERPYVDPDRLGVMGLSGGGTMTLWSSLCDERIKATEIICYSDLWADFGMRDLNYCGMQVAPGLFKLVDLPEAQGLIAPRPLLVDIGAYDSCFKIDTAMACYRQVQAVYRAAGIEDRLELDLFPSEHGWGGNRSRDFFTRHLA